LDDFLGQAGGPPQRTPAPVPAPVPVARAVPAPGPAAAARRSAPAAPGLYSSDAVAKARSTIAKSKKRKRRVLRRAPRSAAAQIRFEELRRPLDRQTLARAVLYAEILGIPRAVSPYSGPPAAG
ncbi:MAG: hypothetical protein ACYTGB_11500, partial [Planctomycetota bacterium]